MSPDAERVRAGDEVDDKVQLGRIMTKRRGGCQGRRGQQQQGCRGFSWVSSSVMMGDSGQDLKSAGQRGRICLLSY